jgi:hypothetical protein
MDVILTIIAFMTIFYIKIIFYTTTALKMLLARKLHGSRMQRYVTVFVVTGE